MIVAVIILAAALALAIGGNIAQGVRATSATAGQLADRAALGIANRTQMLAEAERNAAIARATQAEAEAKSATEAFRTLQRMANAEREEINRRVQAHLESGNAADSAAFLGSLLADPLPGVARAPAATASADRGDAKPPTV